MAIGRRNGNQIPAPHSTGRTPVPECLLISRRRRGRPLRSPTVTFYRWTGSEESRWIWTNRVTQPKMVKIDDVAYVPGLSRNLLSTIKAVEQWGKPLIYYRTEVVLGFPGEESLVFKFFPRRGLFSATGARRIPRQDARSKFDGERIGEDRSGNGAGDESGGIP